MPADYHIHTVYCKHAEGEVEEYVAAAARKGIPEIAFTDHVPAPDGYDLANRMTIELFPEYRAAVDRVRKGKGVEVRFGIEADYYEGGTDFLKTWLPAQEFDLVLGSVHFIGDWGFDNPQYIERWEKADVARTWAEYFVLLGKLADTRLFDVVSHLDLPKKFGHRPGERAVLDMARPALDRVKAANMAIELNTGGLRKPVEEIYPSLTILKLARERDIQVCFGSDAHAPGDVGHRFDQAVALARDAGYTEWVQFRARKQTRIPFA